MRLVEHSLSITIGSLAIACASPKSTPDNTTPPNTDVDAPPVAGQTPPTGATAVEAWLATGAYKTWACEPSPHASRSPSPHGFNRICSNAVIAQNVTGTGAWPVGAAAVKELFASATASTPLGYAVYLKTAADSAGGASWYWYERIETDLIADGRGDSGPARRICVGCHEDAGSDAANTPSPHARDQVFTPVR